MKNILTQQEINHIDQVCEDYKIENYTINLDGSIDVVGDVHLGQKRLDKLPLRFGKVSGGFYCGHNQLYSLEGCPSSVGGNFGCYYNKLSSLEFSPTSVGGDLYFQYNNFPSHFNNLYFKLNHEEIKIFIKYHHDLRIWCDNGYNEEEAQILYEEIKDGML